MSMAADSNTNFHHGLFPPSFCNQHVVSFQSGGTNSTAGINSPGGNSSTTTMMLTGNPSSSNNAAPMMFQGNSQGNLFLEPMAGLKHDTGLAVDWSYKEQAILNHGLLKYDDQPSILKYIKIAAFLPEKTVRDVALRCRWMSRKEHGKRRKLEEYYTEKKVKDRKALLCHQEKKADCFTKVNIHLLGNMASYSSLMNYNSLLNYNNQFLTEVPVINDATNHLLEENAQVFDQIATNLERFKIQDNAHLFLRTRNNITAILNSMSRMPGIMSQMPPLPVTIDEDLVTSILPNTSQAFMFSSPPGISVKQEPRC